MKHNTHRAFCIEDGEKFYTDFNMPALHTPEQLLEEAKKVALLWNAELLGVKQLPRIDKDI